MPDIDVEIPSATWLYAIILQFYGIVMILIYDVVLDLLYLIF